MDKAGSKDKLAFVQRIRRYLWKHKSLEPQRDRGMQLSNLRGNKKVRIGLSELHVLGTINTQQYMDDYIAGLDPSCPQAHSLAYDEND